MSTETTDSSTTFDEQRFKGIPVADGVAVARVCLFRDQGRHTALPMYRVSGDAVLKEQARLGRAVALVGGRLDALKKVVASRIGPAEAEIFVAQRSILDDKSLKDRMLEAIEEGSNAEAAATRVLDSYESKLMQVDHEYLKDRASDIGELKRRLLDILLGSQPEFACGTSEECQKGRGRVIVTEELTPALALEMNTQEIQGIVTERGGPTSHAAILARALGIPCVAGIKDIGHIVSCGTEVLVDGGRGEIVVWPSEETAARALAAAPKPKEAVDPVPNLAVMANISIASEAGDAAAMKAEGIGLYRTEFEFFAAGRLLDEETQVERYASVVQAMDGQPVYVRLLDIGGDKPSPLFEVGEEENPQLGFRGARFLEAHPDLVETQARALARASRDGPVHVMYPMIIDAAQLARLRDVVEKAAADVSGASLKHGAMFEVPSAYLEADAILGNSDFASIGSNDLLQYVFAVDRNNERVAYDSYPDRETFWRLLGHLAEAAEKAEKPISICGELAGRPDYIPRLIELGFASVSVSVRSIPIVRQAASEIPV